MDKQPPEALIRSRAAYGRLKEKWIDELRGNHVNAVWVQLAHMVRTEVWFKAVIHLRSTAGNPPVNDYLWEAF